MDLLKKNMQEEQVLKLDWISAVINQVWQIHSWVFSSMLGLQTRSSCQPWVLWST